jgi:single-strand DNA-binding protein
MLRVILIGNLGGDAEVRSTGSERPVACFSVAVNQVRTTAGSAREESTEWFRVNVAGRQSEFASRLQKGQRVLVDGRLQISRFQHRDGSPGVGFDVWADEIQNLSGRGATIDNGPHLPVTDVEDAAPASDADLSF